MAEKLFDLIETVATMRNAEELSARIWQSSETGMSNESPKHELGVTIEGSTLIMSLLDGAESVSSIEFRPQTIYIGGTLLEAARVGGMLRADNCENQFFEKGISNHFENLIPLAEKYLAQADINFAVVHGNLFLYSEAGYVPCFYHPIATIPTSHALRAKKHFPVRKFVEDDREAMEAYRKKFLRYLPRLLSYQEIPDENILVVEGEGGEMLGYARVRKQTSDWWGKVYVTELAGSSPAVMETFLRVFADMAQEVETDALHFPFSPFHPFSRVCLQFGGRASAIGPTRDFTKDEEMVKILDLSSFLSSLAPELENRLQKAGATRWRGNIYFRTDRDLAAIEIDGPDVSVGGVRSGTTMACMLAMPEALLTQLLFGFRSFEDLEDEPSVSFSMRSREILRALFPATLPASQCDFDLAVEQYTSRGTLCPEALQKISEAQQSQ